MSKVCTYFNERAVDNVLGTWLPSLRKHYAGDVVLFHAGGPYWLKDRTLDDGVMLVDVTVLLDGEKDQDLFFVMLKSWAFFAGGLPAEEPVLIYDGADIGFQEKLDPLIEAMAKSDKLHCMTEPRNICSSPSMIQSLEAILPPDLKRRWWDVLMGQRILNTGLIAGRAETVANCFFELVESLPGVANNWIADQAWVNLYSAMHPGHVAVLEPRWCFDLRWHKHGQNAAYQYVDDSGLVVPVVHAAGHVKIDLSSVLVGARTIAG